MILDRDGYRDRAARMIRALGGVTDGLRGVGCALGVYRRPLHTLDRRAAEIACRLLDGQPYPHGDDAPPELTPAAVLETLDRRP